MTKQLPLKNRLLALVLLCCLYGNGFSQYWQQALHYQIDVTLNDKEKTLDGFERLTYYNHSPDTLHFIWFQVWPNAYKNDRTAFSDQLLENGNTKFYFASKEQRGYINRLDFKVNGITAQVEDHPEHIDIIKVHLPMPLPPAQQAVITTPFHVKLPFNFSRGGYDGNTFQLTQWYPKPAVYDAQGWHPMPYLDQGEFYSNFGRFEVSITVPKSYVVAATGELQEQDEKQWLQSRSQINQPLPEKKLQKPISSNRTSSKAPKSRTSTSTPPAASASPAEETKTLHYRQDNVHDFAWFAQKDFMVNYDTCRLASGRTIEVYTYYTPKEAQVWKNSIALTKDAIRFYSDEIGEYPYNVVSVVQGPESFGGGMEYPTITILSPVNSEKELDILTAHELGHNWFYGILASNERAHPWMDEGINSFYEKKYTEQKYGRQPQFEEILFQSRAHQRKDQPIATTAEEFSMINYLLVAYHKSARWLQWLEAQSGKENFKKAMQDYYSQWQFKHPQPEDFKKHFQSILPHPDSAFALQHQKGLLPNQQLQGFKVLSPLVPSTLMRFAQYPSKNALLLSPVIGANKYDRQMPGLMVTNYKLPPNAFRFLLIPLYAIGSKKFNGLGILNYSLYPQGTFSAIDFGLVASNFSKNRHLDSNGHKVYERFYKFAPSVKATFKSGPRNTEEKWLEARTYFIGEKEFSKFVIKSTDTLLYVDSLQNSTRYLNQLTYQVTNYRALYPYSYQVQLQQGKGFYRLNFTGNYFFTYANGGGAGVRLFAAKFGYLNRHSSNRLGTARYHPKLLGVTGDEDYSYSDYFIGRSASYANDESVVQNSGLAAQQIMIRDGGLKLRLDQYEFLQGRSDNWVAAINLTTTLPPQLLPIKLPIKLFLDAGSFAEAWESDATVSRFLYVGGLQLSLLKNAINIYAPLVYSKDFRDNLKALPEQNKFYRKITFSIDFTQLSLKNLTSNQFSF